MYEEYVIAEGWLALYGALEHPCCYDCAISCSFRCGTFCVLSPYSKLLQLSVNDKRSLFGGICFCVFLRKRQRAKAQVGISAFGKAILICSFHSKKRKKKEQAEG